MTTARDFRKLDVAIVVLSAITYLVDVATDVLVTVQYMVEGQLMWFTLTLAFIVVPMVLMQVFSLKWYIAETNARISFLNGFLHSIGLALLKRYASVLMTWSDVKTSADPALIEKLFLQINDVFLLRLFQCFLESAPQLVLQTYVAISQWYVSLSTAFSIFFSLVSLAWGFATYTDILRLTYRDSYQRKWSGLLLQVGWQIGMVISRIMTIVMFGICFQGWLFLPIFVHWFLMTVWIIAEKPKFSCIWWEDKLYSFVVGFIYIFCFLNVQEGRTRWRMFFFYALQMLENSLVVVLWMIVENPLQQIYQWLFTAIVYIGFLVGIVCLLLFYGCYHPDKKDADNSSEEIGPEQPTQTVQSLRRSSRRCAVSSSSITSNTSLMNPDGKQPFSYRREPIGCPDVSADVRFLRINDGTPTFNSGGNSKFPAFNHGMLQDDDEVDESATKIFSSTAVHEETPRALKFVRRTTSQSEMLSSFGQTGVESKIPSSKFGSSKSQLTLLTRGLEGEIDLSQHIGYCPQKGYTLNVASPPTCQEPRGRQPLGRHNSENIRSTRVSTVDNLSHKYQQFRESWDGSDRYIQMLEKYCDREDRPAKYTYLNSVYEPTTKPMERKIKENPLTKLRSSFRRHIDAMRNLNYKEMSPVLNPNQYFTSRESLKSNQGPSLFRQNPPFPEGFNSSENQHRMFYNTYHSKENIATSQKYPQDCAHRSSPSCAGSNQCLRRGQGYEQTSHCDHGCVHKRRSYSENCSDGQQQAESLYCMQKAHHSGNPPNDPRFPSHYPNTTDRCGLYNQPVNSSYLTLPHRLNRLPNGHTTSSAFSQCYPTLRNPGGQYPNYHPPSSDLTTYVVYSDKPSVSRCTSAPPSAPQSYGSLRRNAIAGNRKINDDVVVDHNDFRYCTVSSVRSESAPPSDNFVRASFKNQRRLQPKSDSFKSNQDSAIYDFRQLTVSPVQSMSVPPDKVFDLESLRNLTVSPVRSVSVMPNQSPEQDCFGNYLQPPNRSASVPPNFFQTYNAQNFPASRTTTMSDSSDTSFTYGTSTDRPTTPNDNFTYGKMTVCSDGIVSIPPVPQGTYKVKEKFSASSNLRTVSSSSSSDSVGHNGHQDEVSDSSVFSYKHPYLPERKLSVPYHSPKSTTSSDSDSQSVTSFSSLPDSTSETLSRNGIKPNRDSEREGNEIDPWCQEGQNTIQRSNSNNEFKSGKNDLQTNAVSRHGATKQESKRSQYSEISKTNSSDPKTLENYPNPSKNIDRIKSMKRMSSHVHGGISIDPSNSDDGTTDGNEPQETQKTQAASLEGLHKVQDDSSVPVVHIGSVPAKSRESTSPVHLQKETIQKPEALTEAVSSSSESNLSGNFGQQITQSYAPIDPNQFSLQKFRDCTRSQLYSPEVSKTHSKKITTIDFYTDRSRPNKNSSDRSVNHRYSLPSLEMQGGESDEEVEEERKRPQIPKNLPEEKPRLEQSLRNRNLVLSPLTIKQLKSSPLKLGRSLSICSADKSRLSKLRDKLSPLRIQNLVHSPFKFGRNIDLRKKWRSANDIVEDTNVEKNKCMLVNSKLFKNNQTPSLSGENKPSSKSSESVRSMSKREVMNLKYLHGEDSETDSDPNSLGTLIDCDWALDVLDQLSRISDHHGSSFSDDSLQFTKYASWTDLTDLPKQEMAEEMNDNLNFIPRLVNEVKGNGISERGAADGGEESEDKNSDAPNSNLKRNQISSAENQNRISDEIFRSEFKPGEALDKAFCEESIPKAENISSTPESKCDDAFEGIFENSTEDIFENSVTEEPDSANGLTSYQEFERALAPSKDSKGDLFPKEKKPKGFVASQDVQGGTMKQDFYNKNARTDNCTNLCEKANYGESTNHTSNKSMTRNSDKGPSPQKIRTKTYISEKNTEKKRSRRPNQGRGSKGRKKQKESLKNCGANVISQNLYRDGDISLVHEDHISVGDDSKTSQNVACWENWDSYEDEDDNDADNLDSLKNDLIRGAMSSEVNYPWEVSITETEESDDTSREGAAGILNNAFLSDNEKFYQRVHCYWPRSRYPKTVSRSVDPLLMPTIHEHKMMTEQFIYDDEDDDDDEGTDTYHFNDPRLTVPAFELYDDRRSKTNKYSSYFREKSRQSANDTHPATYMTVPARDSSRAWNSMNQKHLFSEEFFPKSETESSDSYAFL